MSRRHLVGASLLFLLLIVGACATSTPSPEQYTHRDYAPHETPAGELLFYSYRGGQPDLYLRTVSGEDVNLTNNTNEFDIGPTLHPNSSTVAYSSGSTMSTLSIKVMSLPDDQPQILIGPTEAISYNHPTWSPDGEWLTYNVNNTEAETGDIYVARADGSDARNLTPTLGGGNGGSTWTPDGQWVVFSHQAGTGWETLGDVYAVHVETGHLLQLTETEDISEVPRGFTPDGQSLVLSHYPQGSTNQIALMTVEQTEASLRLTNKRILSPSDTQHYYASAISHDGQSVLYSVGTRQTGFAIQSMPLP